MAPSPDPTPIPEGYHMVIPYLNVRGAEAALRFYADAFGAEERFRMPGPEGKLAHAEIRIGDSHIMLADEFEDWGNRSPQSLGGSPVTLMLYVDDVDAVFDRAIEAGGTSVHAVENQFWGDRSGVLEDPFGHQWRVSTRVEDVPPEEMDRRMKEMMGQMEG